MKKTLCRVLAAGVLALAGAGCARTEAERVSTDGSTSMEKVIGTLGEAFEADHSGTRFTYNPTGSGAGIAAALEGRCDIGLSSRALKEEEKAGGLTETVLAYDGIAVIVHPDNPVADLSLADLAAIYTGEITDWKDVGGGEGELWSLAGKRAAAPGTALRASPTPRAPAGTVRSSPPAAMSSPPWRAIPTPSATPLWRR